MRSNFFGNKLKQFRKVMNLTQADLGKMLRVSQVAIANYESGDRFPKHNTLVEIAKIFDIPLDDLLETREKAHENLKFSPDYNFDISSLLSILMKDPLETALSYTVSWKNSDQLDLLTFYEKILIPTLEKTGELWMKGEILVSEEHLISEKVRDLILLHSNREWERNPVSPDKNKRWMGLCAPGEKHYLGLLMNAQVMRLAGWSIYFLGTQVPFQDLSGIIKKYSPHVLALSVSMKENMEGLEMYIREIQERFNDSPAVILGGQGIGGSLILNSPNQYRSDSIREGLEIAEQIFIDR